MEQAQVKVILRWLWLLVLIPVIAGAIVYVYANNRPTTYEAQSLMIIGPGIDSPNPDLDALRAGAQLMQTYAELPRTEVFLDALIEGLNLSLSRRELVEKIDIRPLVDTQIFKIVVQDDDPDRAIAIANGVADHLKELSPSTEFIDSILENMQAQAIRIEGDIELTQERIAEINRHMLIEEDPSRQNLLVQQLAAEERRLSDANTTLTALYEMIYRPLTNQVKIANYAEQAEPLSKQLPLYVSMAVGAGIILSIVLAVLLIFLDSGLATPESLTRLPDAPFWGMLNSPRGKPGTLVVDSAPQSAAAGQYRALSVHVNHAHAADAMRSVLVASADRADGVASMAANLAVTLAKTNKRVALIDADLRADTIRQMFKIESKFNLVAALKIDDTEVQLADVNGFPQLKVLPSGVSAANSFDLVASPRMKQVLECVAAQTEIVIVAGPPLAAYQDTLAMAPHVDGVVLVARSRRTQLANLRDVIGQLRTVGAQVMGVVAAGRSRF